MLCCSLLSSTWATATGLALGLWRMAAGARGERGASGTAVPLTRKSTEEMRGIRNEKHTEATCLTCTWLKCKKAHEPNTRYCMQAFPLAVERTGMNGFVHINDASFGTHEVSGHSQAMPGTVTQKYPEGASIHCPFILLSYSRGVVPSGDGSAESPLCRPSFAHST